MERKKLKAPVGLTPQEAQQLEALVDWHPGVGILLKVLERQHDVLAELVEAHNEGHYHQVGDFHAGQDETSEDYRFAPDEPQAPAPTKKEESSHEHQAHRQVIQP